MKIRVMWESYEDRIEYPVLRDKNELQRFSSREKALEYIDQEFPGTEMHRTLSEVGVERLFGVLLYSSDQNEVLESSDDGDGLDNPWFS